MMEKCKGCKWNFEGMVCPEYRFCGKSMERHDNEVIEEAKGVIIKKLKETQKNNDDCKDNAKIGYYNGIEYCLSILEERKPVFKDYINI